MLFYVSTLKKKFVCRSTSCFCCGLCLLNLFFNVCKKINSEPANKRAKPPKASVSSDKISLNVGANHVIHALIKIFLL